jgi:hypothetical protein
VKVMKEYYAILWTAPDGHSWIDDTLCDTVEEATTLTHVRMIAGDIDDIETSQTIFTVYAK